MDVFRHWLWALFFLVAAGCDDGGCPSGQVDVAGSCVECGDDGDCGVGHCSDLYRCVECTADGHCPEGVCADDGRCVACVEDSDCLYGWCSGEQCQGYLGIGSPCDRDAMCVTDNCHDGTCLGSAGDGCEAGTQCESGICTDGLCCLDPCDGPCERCSVGGVCEAVASGHDDGCATYCVEGNCQKCPEGMADTGTSCMDLYEAPGVAGGLPFVMFTFNEADAWCVARGKRLCLDTEWTAMCEGPDQTAYVYGDTRVPGVCNDDETWLSYNQTLLSQWPYGVATPEVETLEELIQLVTDTSTAAAESAAHVMDLYQAEPSGSNEGCTNVNAIFDLTGNVEEWTRRADGGTTDFHGNLKGRYWADTRTCQNNITTHGDGFRFYEIGFRCCMDHPDGE